MIRAQLQRNRVDLLRGAARFVDEHTVEVVEDRRGEHRDGHRRQDRRSPPAPGRRGPRRSSSTTAASSTPTASSRSEQIPARMVVVGAGVIGIEYASMFAALGTRVTVVERATADARLLRRRGRRVAEVPPARPRGDLPVRRDGRRGRGVRPRHRDDARERQEDPGRDGDVLGGPSGRHRPALDVERAGLEADDRGRLKVDEHYRTAVAAHLRRRRRHRLPRARRDLDGAGPAGRVPRVRRAGAVDDRGARRSGSTRSRRSATAAPPRPS